MATTTSTKDRPPSLPPDFLSGGPPPDMNFERIDFLKTRDPLPEYKDNYAAIIDKLLTPEECSLLLEAAEASSITDDASSPSGQGRANWGIALVNAGNGKQTYAPDDRHCGRIVFDSSWVADRLFARLLPIIAPDIERIHNASRVTGLGPVKRNETWRVTRLNERLRFLRYQAGDYFRPHIDGNYTTPEGGERSYYTIHLYLNGDDGPQPSQPQPQSEEEGFTDTCAGHDAPLIGGATTFHPSWLLEEGGPECKINPKKGSVLVFQQRDMAHSGEDVIQGTKYTMRTDLMYKKE